MELVLDIETIIDPKTVHLIPEQKAKKENTDVIGKFRFDSNFNRICTIGLYNNDGIVEFLMLNEFDSEAKMLEEFWKIVNPVTRIITFNGLSFDIPHLYKRSWLNKIKPTIFISLAKYRVDNHVDIRAILSNWDSYACGTLDFYYNLISESQDKIIDLHDGSDMQYLWENKSYELIKKHCSSDCLKLWKLYQSMIGYYHGV